MNQKIPRSAKALPDRHTKTVSAESAAGLRRNHLLGLLEGSIVPALLERLPPQVVREELKALGPALQTPEEIAAFAKLCLLQDGTIATAFARQMVADGVIVGAIFDGLIAPAARHLGHLWDSDVCGFEQVTLGLSRMQSIAMVLSQKLSAPSGHAGRVLRALFAPLPGSQHTLGVLMVSELFQNEGWEVAMETGATEAQLLAAVRRERIDVVGLSISLQDDINPLADLIRALRTQSQNPRLKVLIGGPVLGKMEGLELRVGADAGAADAKVTQKLAKALALALHSADPA